MNCQKDKNSVVRVLALQAGHYSMDDGIKLCGELFEWSPEDAEKHLATGRELAGRDLGREEYNALCEEARRAFFVVRFLDETLYSEPMDVLLLCAILLGWPADKTDQLLHELASEGLVKRA